MRALYLALIITFAAQAAAAANIEVDQLRTELEAMKAERARQDEQMRLLEERIRALEAKSSTPPAPAVVAAGQAREMVDKEFQQDTESREEAMLSAQHPYAGRVQEVLQGFNDERSFRVARESMLALPSGFLVPEERASNRSLTVAEAELVRRLNEEFSRRAWPHRSYARFMRYGVTEQLKTGRRPAGLARR